MSYGTGEPTASVLGTSPPHEQGPGADGPRPGVPWTANGTGGAADGRPPRRARPGSRAVRFVVLVVLVVVLLVGSLLTYPRLGDRNAGADDGTAATTDGSSTGTQTPDPTGQPAAPDGTGPIATDGGTDPTAAPDGTDPTTAPGGTDGEVPIEPPTDGEAERAVVDYLAVVDDILSTPPFRLDRLDGVATGSARTEVEATVSEYVAEEVHQDGAVTVRSIEVDGYGTTNDGRQTAVVATCVDASAVRLLRSTGDPVLIRDDLPRTTLHLYGLVRDGGRWIVATHAFPDDADC